MKEDIFEGGKRLPLMEEFYTVQGEGYNTGKAAYFIRIGGCDVGCSWCDTKPSWSMDKFPPTLTDEIVNRVVETPAKTVVVTGGEPSMYELDYFTSKLKEKGIITMIETSGAYPLTGDWDWICLSPKKQSPPVPEIFKRAHELKVVVPDPSAFKWAEQTAAFVNEDCKLYLQPEWSVSDKMIPLIVEYVKENPQWQISIQAHKYMRVP
ncbi:MAG: 7-carboxy-7-deazaguanine synthase QueE [Hyphomicrobiales bacterium]